MAKHSLENVVLRTFDETPVSQGYFPLLLWIWGYKAF